MNVLVVDDDAIDIETVRRALRKAEVPAVVTVAQNGFEALDRLRELRHSLVLLDINLPRMNGIEFLKIVRQDEALKDTRVVVLTTSNAERDKQATDALGVSAYMLKPFTPDKALLLLATG